MEYVLVDERGGLRQTFGLESHAYVVELLDQLSAVEAFGRAAEPWEVAATIAFLASDYSSYLTGEVISVSSQRA